MILKEKLKTSVKNEIYLSLVKDTQEDFLRGFKRFKTPQAWSPVGFYHSFYLSFSFKVFQNDCFGVCLQASITTGITRSIATTSTNPLFSVLPFIWPADQ